MSERLDYASIAGSVLVSIAQAKNGIAPNDRKLRAIVELCVSQINGGA